MLRILVVTLVTCLSSLAHAGGEYPKSFLWGAALSAHQTEGSLAGGGTGSDWYRHEHRRKPVIANGDTADLAVDHWNRYAEDFDLARSIGLESIRNSIAWEKVEPEPGKFNPEIIAHYREVLKAMHARGIKP